MRTIASIFALSLATSSFADERKLGVCYTEDAGTLYMQCEKTSIEMSTPEAFGEMLKNLKMVIDADAPGYFEGTTGMVCRFNVAQAHYIMECMYPQKSPAESS